MADSSLGVDHQTAALRSAATSVRRWRRRGWALALFLGVAGTAISVGVAWLLSNEDQTLLVSRFHSHAGRRVGVIARELKERLGTADTLAAFFEGSSLVMRKEFDTFSARIQQRHPSIEMLAWAPRVAVAQRGRVRTIASHAGRGELPNS